MTFIASTILSLFLSYNLKAADQSKILEPKEIAYIEDKIKTELENFKNNETKKFFINLRAGREFYQFRFYEKSKEYYQGAIKCKTSENKTEAYINLMAIAVVIKDKSSLKDNYQNSLKYFEENKKFKSSSVDYYLNTIAGLVSAKEFDPNKPIKGFYGHFYHEENLISLLEDKEYEKAFSLINPESLKNSTDDFHITVYDSLNVYLNRKKVKELYCDKQYKEYPDAFAFSTLICGMLNDYLHDTKPSELTLKMRKDYFEKENKSKKFLYDLAREIK